MLLWFVNKEPIEAERSKVCCHTGKSVSHCAFCLLFVLFYIRQSLKKNWIPHLRLVVRSYIRCWHWQVIRICVILFCRLNYSYKHNFYRNWFIWKYHYVFRLKNESSRFMCCKSVWCLIKKTNNEPEQKILFLSFHLTISQVMCTMTSPNLIVGKRKHDPLSEQYFLCSMSLFRPLVLDGLLSLCGLALVMPLRHDMLPQLYFISVRTVDNGRYI